MTKIDPCLMSVRIQAMEEARPYLACVDEIAELNTGKVLEAFRQGRVSDYHFRSTSGYGYGDSGRDKLDEIWALICGAESAIVRSQFVSGTHALATVLFGIMRPGDELLSVTGPPYDTMQTVIGVTVPARGSLKEWGITYREVPMDQSGINWDAVRDAITPHTRVALIQRSRGYCNTRPTLTVSEIETICMFIKKIKSDCICFIDNCYGEFVETLEPTACGADIMAGSLIKNPGGGLVPAGGYIAGKRELVDMASYRLTAPGIGSHVGASLSDTRLLYQGIFQAPHVVAQALKGAIFAAALFSILGFPTTPSYKEKRGDIIQAIELGSAEKMIAFCQGLQKSSPVDAFVIPEPCSMPGYTDQIIMAAGTFIQGSTIELSADGPIRPPYCLYLQGGLTFEHALLGMLGAASSVMETKKLVSTNRR